LYPATISASASGKSKGLLFVSANEVIKNIIKIGKNGIINHIFFCAKIISIRFIDFVNKKRGNNNKPK